MKRIHDETSVAGSVESVRNRGSEAKFAAGHVPIDGEARSGECSSSERAIICQLEQLLSPVSVALERPKMSH